MAGIFNSTIFNNTIFNTGAAVAAPTPVSTGGGGGGGMYPRGKKRRYLDKELESLVAEVAAELKDDGIAVLPVIDSPPKTVPVEIPAPDWAAVEREAAALTEVQALSRELAAAEARRAEQEEEEELLLLQLV